MENVRKHRDIKLIIKEKRKDYLVSKQNYHTTKFFPKNLLAIEMKKTEILMSKPVCLRLSILELRKISMYEFWYDYAKQNCVIWVQIVLLYTDKQMIFIRTLQKMLKLDLILQIMN